MSRLELQGGPGSAALQVLRHEVGNPRPDVLLCSRDIWHTLTKAQQGSLDTRLATVLGRQHMQTSDRLFELNLEVQHSRSTSVPVARSTFVRSTSFRWPKSTTMPPCQMDKTSFFSLSAARRSN